MARLIWSPRALADLQRLHRFLVLKSRRSADSAVSTIQRSVWLLREFPASGRPVEGRDPERRELLVPFGQGGYGVAYAFHDDIVSIIDVRHQREAGY